MNRATRSAPTTTAISLRFETGGSPDPNRLVVRLTDPREVVVTVVDAQATNDLEVVVAESGRRSELMPDGPGQPRPVRVILPEGQWWWRPGRAVFVGETAPTGSPPGLPAVARFAVLEADLRAIELAAVPFERSAAADVDFAYRIEKAGPGVRDRFAAAMESLARLRLGFARLEPALLVPPLTMSALESRLFRRLVNAAGVADRLEAIGDRLEACEDLYEGAVDRMTDHRWYRRGMWVELAITALLALEVVQLAVQLLFRK